jgi:hypothetical protein
VKPNRSVFIHGVWALVWALALPAGAQTTRQQSPAVFKCGNEGLALSDRPCRAGASASSVAFDEPSRSDAAAAKARAEQDAKAAKRLQRSRERQERQARKAHARLSTAPAPARPASSPKPFQAGGKEGSKKKSSKAAP